MYINAQKINKLRKVLAEEAVVEFGILNVEHWRLVEMRLQTLLMVGLEEGDIKDVEDNKKRKE